jgi:ABC-2 type transport system ATP-binding protein
LAVCEGECFGVLGPNGAGKTTTIEILEGLLEPSYGNVEILGMQWRNQADAIRQEIGISLQETKFSEKLSVLETLTLFRSFYRRGLDPREAIAQVGLEEKASVWVKRLSGGQRQRLAVAAALIGIPRLLFLDEPTTGLDPQSRRQLWDIIRRFRQQGRTVLLTTHYMEEAERLCDRVAIVDHGKIIAQGSPRELIAGLGAEHVIEFSLDADSVELPPAEFWLGHSAVTAAHRDDHGYRLSVTQPHLAIPSLLERIEMMGTTLSGLTTRHASLDDVFVSLAGRPLEDQAEVSG